MTDSSNIVLFDGAYHQKLKPLTFTRPVADLRVGILKLGKNGSFFYLLKLIFDVKII